MNSDVEKFIKGESKNAYNYFGAHRVNDGVCFRLYAPHALKVELVLGENTYPLEKIDFRGVFETRVKEIKEFDTYQYEILNKDNTWINKNDPFSFYNDSNKSVYIDLDEYVFNDEKWNNKAKEMTYFNACIVNDSFKMDEQRSFIEYLKTYNYNYVILRPHSLKYLFCVDKKYINDSSLKTFIDNLHSVNIGVILDLNIETFYDYAEGIDNFDGEPVYNLNENKYAQDSHVYFDYSKNATKSYLYSFINYYLEKFHGDGLLLSKNEFSLSLESQYEDKLFIYKEDVNDLLLNQVIDNFNKGFDYKAFLELDWKQTKYLYYDFNEIFNRINANEKVKKQLAFNLLALTFVSNNLVITDYNEDEDYLRELRKLTDLYKNSRLLAYKDTKKLLLNGKKANYFVYEFSYRNDYLILLTNFSNIEDDKFDLGMPYYGYYELVIDTDEVNKEEEPLFTRNKKAQGKELAMKLHLKPYGALVYKRMKDI